MAFTLPGAGSRIVVQANYVDEANQQSQTKTEIPFDTDLTTTIANAVAHLALLQAVTGANLSSGSIVVPVADAVAPAAAVKSDVGHDGQLSLNLDVSGTAKTKSGTVHIPAPADAVRVATTGKQFYVLNTSNAAIIALAANFLAAGDCTISDGQKSLSIASGNIKRKRLKTRTS